MATNVRAVDILHVVYENYNKLNLNYAKIFTNTLIVDITGTTDRQIVYEKITQLYNAHISPIQTISFFSSNISVSDIIDGLEKGKLYIYIKPLYLSPTLCDALILKDYYDIFYFITTIIANTRICKLQQECVECTTKVFNSDRNYLQLSSITVINHLRYNQVHCWLRFIIDSVKRLEHKCKS